MKTKWVNYAAIAGIVVVVLTLAASTLYFYRQYRKVNQSPQTQAEEETKVYVAKISRFMELPSDETPTIATVVDKDKLKDQVFFKKALNGDKVIIYVKARRAILYRPTTNRVIDMVPLTINDQTNTASPTPVASNQDKNIRVAILNGSSTVGLSGETEKKLTGISGITVVSKGDAKNNYGQTTVVDLNGGYAGIASDIAQLLGGKVASLPAGENSPEADILVIAGK